MEHVFFDAGTGLKEGYAAESAKRGIKRMGFIRNLNTYASEIRKLISETFDYNTLDAYIDSELDNGNIFYYNTRFEPVSQNSLDIKYKIISSGYRTHETNEAIYVGFSLVKEMWCGVVVGTQKMVFEQWKDEASSDNFYNNIFCNNWKPVSSVLSKLLDEEKNEEETKEFVETLYKNSSREKNLYIYASESGKKIMYFFSGLFTKVGEKIWFYTEVNARKDALQKWYGLYCAKESELWRVIFDMNFFNIEGLVFGGIHAANLFFNKLAEKAIPENWAGLLSKKGAYDLPILKGYIENTYSRLCCEALNEDGKIVDINGYRYFNSGLLDTFYRQIIIRAASNEVSFLADGIGKHTFEYFDKLSIFTENEPEIAMMFNSKTLPKLASYFEEYRDVVFDTSLEIKLQDVHIFEDGIRRGRIPMYTEKYEACRNDKGKRKELLTEIARDFDSAVKRTSIIAKRNYKLAVPQYIKEANEIQYMLPIYLHNIKDIPDCILSLKLEKNGPVAYYRGTTILTPEMAYNNARLISGPDLHWIGDLMSA